MADMKVLLSATIMFLLVGMVIGVGLMTFDAFGTATKTATSALDQNVNLSSHSATLANTFCTAITQVDNVTTWDLTTYNVSLTDADTCAMYADVPVSHKYNVTYTYREASKTSTMMDAASTALAAISSSWIGLLITIVVLSLIVGLVISSFTGIGRN
jgi:hypothetical protein